MGYSFHSQHLPTGLRGLLLESTLVNLRSEDVEIGDPHIDEHLMRVMKSFFGGWAKPFFVLFDSNGFGPAKTENCNRDDPEVAAIIPEDREIEAEISKLKNADDLPNGNILGSSGSEESGK